MRISQNTPCGGNVRIVWQSTAKVELAPKRFGAETTWQSTSPKSPPNALNKPRNWLLEQVRFLLRPRKIGGYPLNMAEVRAIRREIRPQIAAVVEAADQVAYPFVTNSDALKYSGYNYQKGIPPSLVWAKPGENSQPLRQNTNGLIARILIDILKDPAQTPPANSMEEAVARLHELRQQLTDLSMEKALALPGVKRRSGGWYRQLWRHYFPELRPRCENIEKPFAYRLQGLAPGIFSLAATRREVYSMIQIHHLVMISPNGGLLMTTSPNYAQTKAMIESDPEAQRVILQNQPLSKTGWGFLRGFHSKDRLNLEQTLDILQKQADKTITYRTQNDWSDIETLLREVPFDLKKHIEAGRIKVLLDKPGANGRSVLSYL